MEEHSIYIVRKTDGMIGRMDIQELGDEWDLWTTIEHYFPRAWEMMDEKNILAVDEDQYDRDVDEIFDYGEDSDLCDWLETVRVVVRDSNGAQTAFEGFDERRHQLVIRAVDWATETIEHSGADTAEVQVTITIGDDEVWSWQEALRVRPVVMEIILQDGTRKEETYSHAYRDYDDDYFFDEAMSLVGGKLAVTKKVEDLVREIRVDGRTIYPEGSE